MAHQHSVKFKSTCCLNQECGSLFGILKVEVSSKNSNSNCEDSEFYFLIKTEHCSVNLLLRHLNMVPHPCYQEFSKAWLYSTYRTVIRRLNN